MKNKLAKQIAEEYRVCAFQASDEHLRLTKIRPYDTMPELRAQIQWNLDMYDTWLQLERLINAKADMLDMEWSAGYEDEYREGWDMYE